MNVTPDPNDLVLSVLHRAGSGLLFKNDAVLIGIFNDAAKSDPLFGAFAWHPHYHYSKVLDRTIATMVCSSIVFYRSDDKLMLSEHGCGPYGARVFRSLPLECQNKVDDIARKVKEAFETPTACAS